MFITNVIDQIICHIAILHFCDINLNLNILGKSKVLQNLHQETKELGEPLG